MSQPPNPGLSLGREEWEASVHRGVAFSGGYNIQTKIHADPSIPLDKIIQSQNERPFEYHWPLTLKHMHRFFKCFSLGHSQPVVSILEVYGFRKIGTFVQCYCHRLCRVI